MAAGTILTVLTNIPWGAVVENAPKVADGAAKLWNTVARWNKSDPVQNGQIETASKNPVSDTALLSAQLQAVEESVRHLNEQMQASVSLIKELAEQNTLLVERIEANRLRLLRLSVVGGCICAVLIGTNLYLLFTH